MPFPVRSIRVIASALLVAVSLAACGDDDNTNPPATPPAPTGLTATPSGDGTSIEVAWTAVTGATSYALERAEGQPAGAFAEVGGDLTEANYTDTDIETDVVYSYRVAAVNAEGTGSFSSTVTAGVEGEAVDTLTGDITADRTLFADTLYVLSGYVKVASGATLTVEAGTTIVGDEAVAGQLALDPSRRADRRGRHRRLAHRLHLGQGRGLPRARRLGWAVDHRQRHHQPQRRHTDRGSGGRHGALFGR